MFIAKIMILKAPVNICLLFCFNFQLSTYDEIRLSKDQCLWKCEYPNFSVNAAIPDTFPVSSLVPFLAISLWVPPCLSSLHFHMPLTMHSLITESILLPWQFPTAQHPDYTVLAPSSANCGKLNTHLPPSQRLGPLENKNVVHLHFCSKDPTQHNKWLLKQFLLKWITEEELFVWTLLPLNCQPHLDWHRQFRFHSLLTH